MKDDQLVKFEAANQQIFGPYDASSILAVLPHRYPFLMVDRVLEVKTAFPLPQSDGVRPWTAEQLAKINDARKGTTVKAVKNISLNDQVFQGHFPGRPIFPGVLTLEAMAQVGVFAALPFLMSHNLGRLPEFDVALASYDRVRFRRPVLPGDQLMIQLNVLNVKGNVWSMAAEASVAQQKVAEGEFLAHLVMKTKSGVL